MCDRPVLVVADANSPATGPAVDAGARSRVGRDLVVVFLLQLVVLTVFRLILPADLAVNESPDFTGFYEPVAGSLADGDGLEIGPGIPAVRYPPGYPLVLAAAFRAADVVGVDRQAVLAPLTVLLAAIAGVLLHLIARRIFDRRHAWVTSLIWLTYPLWLWATKQPNSEIPFMVVLYAALLVLTPVIIGGDGPERPFRSGDGPERPFRAGDGPGGRLLGAGGLLGAAAVVRPAGLVLLPAVLLWTWLRIGAGRGRRVVACLALVVGFVVPVGVASIWMSQAGGTAVLLSDSPDLNVIDGLSLAIESPSDLDGVPMTDGLRDFMLDAHAREREIGREGTVVDYLREAAIDHPMVMVELAAHKAARSWFGTESFRFEGATIAVQLVFLGLVGVGARRSLREDPGRRWYTLLAVLITMAAWLSTIVALSIVRYLVPALGLLAPLAAVSVVAAVPWVRQLVAGRRGVSPGGRTPVVAARPPGPS